MACALPRSALADGDGGLHLNDCRLQSPLTTGSIAARCGTLRVPEDRERPQSGGLELHVAVIPALRLRARADAVAILTGGPGQAASDFYVTSHPAFARIRRDRDILLVDQRGTGRSNRLDCEYPEDVEIATFDAEVLSDLTQRCLALLPGDPRFYTTSVAVRDLDEVRAALGYEQLNLYAISYGTRVAQHYMRRYPERVRTAILDGVVAPDMPLGPDIPLVAQRALDELFARCARAPECDERFPELPESFAGLRARVDANAVSVRLADPLTGEPTVTPFGPGHLASAVRLLSYSDETAALLPLLIHEAQTSGELHGLAAQALMIQRSVGHQIAYGMHFAVLCSEDAPRWAEIARDSLRRTYLGTEFMESLQAICGAWPRGVVDDDFGEPLVSDIPVLMLSGSNDPVTPHDYAQHVLQGLSRGRHLVLEGQGHGQIGIGCMPRLAAQFVGSASAEFLDTQCAEQVAPMPFMLSRSAPAP